MGRWVTNPRLFLSSSCFIIEFPLCKAKTESSGSASLVLGVVDKG